MLEGVAGRRKCYVLDSGFIWFLFLKNVSREGPSSSYSEPAGGGNACLPIHVVCQLQINHKKNILF